MAPGLRCCTQTSAMVKTTQPITRTTSQPSASCGRPTRAISAAMPSAVKRLCEATSAVFEMTTEAKASDAVTRQGRSRYALTGSPSAAAGVRLFTASPAMRVSIRRRKRDAPARAGRQGETPAAGVGDRDHEVREEDQRSPPAEHLQALPDGFEAGVVQEPAEQRETGRE